MVHATRSSKETYRIGFSWLLSDVIGPFCYEELNFMSGWLRSPLTLWGPLSHPSIADLHKLAAPLIFIVALTPQPFRSPHVLIWIINKVQEHHSTTELTPNMKPTTGQYLRCSLADSHSSNDFSAIKRGETCRVLISPRLRRTDRKLDTRSSIAVYNAINNSNISACQVNPMYVS